tara:strand:- start:171 stop:563 length:393 start_codon:yes stop_codon:yes gene_type:complete
MKIERLEELLVLKKAIINAKFYSNNDKSNELAKSTLLAKLVKEINEECKILSKLHKLGQNEDWDDVSKNIEILNSVGNRLKSIPNWSSYEFSIRKEVLDNILSPFYIKDQMIYQNLLNLNSEGETPKNKF